MKFVNGPLSAGFTSAVALLSLIAFIWPVLLSSAASNQSKVAQTTFLILMPLLIGLMLVAVGSRSLNSRQIAVLGVLIALNSVVRMLGAGTAGIETIFFLILIGGYALGASFGYLLGAGSMLVSALLTGGFGPWLPFQMMAAGLLGYLVGYLPHPRHRWVQLVWLSVFGVMGAYLYGALLTMWNWPYLAGAGGSLGYLPGASLPDNLWRFFTFELVTGGLLWDTGRAVTTVVLLWLTAPALLTTLSRVARKAGFEKAS
jgi:energy-coupling factor transport system substrate-specific component